MLNKRLYKKAGFMITIALVILTTLSMIYFVKDTGGAVTVSLFAKDKEDPVASEIIKRLTDDKSIINFKVYDSEEDAVNSVKDQKADSAWIFRENISEAIVNYVKDKKSIVTIYEKEENIYLKLSREKLYAVLYQYISYNAYVDFTTAKLHVEDVGALNRHYEKVRITGDLINVKYSDSTTEFDSVNLLVTPLRGILSLILMFGCLSSILYFLRDRDKGLFSFLPSGKHIFLEFGYAASSAFNIALTVFIALFFTDLFTDPANELICLVLYTLMCINFSILISRIFRTVSWLSAAIPILIIAMLALCPVFLNLTVFPVFKYLLPPYHYLTSVYSSGHIRYMLLYIVITYALCFITRKRSI